MPKSVQRIDPRDCGCTDCLLGESVPLDVANADQITAMLIGTIADATSEGLTVYVSPLAGDSPSWVVRTEAEPRLTWELTTPPVNIPITPSILSYAARVASLDVEVTPELLRHLADRLEKGEVVTIPAHGSRSVTSSGTTFDVDESALATFRRPS